MCKGKRLSSKSTDYRMNVIGIEWDRSLGRLSSSGRAYARCVEFEAYRYAGGSEAKAMALCYITVEPKVRLSSVALW